ncbi:hypothetical protein EDC56_0994 [Sinobacterium caligoides]|uniref:Uncharacterized protein n=1 Tax=Sinobacterium caligoides TaxID=933926 RepID=A0A3N2E054_9GAMM|nr:hypothetical protein [Sinobacterium caligoides]ROS05464.1 hypothetical protein EDC56_0994 [Sinobacterium caligoides]
MQQCPRCGHHFGYWKMLTTLLKLTCPLCGSLYRIIPKRRTLHWMMILATISLIMLLQQLLPSSVDWLSYLTLLCLLLVAPFNQRIDRVG